MTWKFVHYAHRLSPAKVWQDRAELSSLLEWWKQGGAGVVELVGMGGVGKTAIVERFLQLLPGVTEPLPGVMQETSLPVPEGVFVFSFEAAPSPETFFDTVNAWLARSAFNPPASARRGGSTLLDVASSPPATDRVTGRCRRLLIILDGMEKARSAKVLSDGTLHIEGAALRKLLLWTADGLYRRVSLVVTTRFEIADLMQQRERGAAVQSGRIAVAEMTADACINLLRGCSVEGNDADLARLADDCGRHALTVDLMARYITQFHRGRIGRAPQLPMSTALKRTAVREGSLSLGVVAEQKTRLECIAEFYSTALLGTDRAALELLQRLCLFRLGATEELLARAFLGRHRQAAAGPSLSALSRQELKKCLARLVDMGLVEAHGELRPRQDNQNDERYLVHPALRREIWEPLGVKGVKDAQSAIRDALKTKIEELPDKGDAFQTDPNALDVMEEWMFHLHEAGHTEGAADVYYFQMGRFHHLGLLGRYEQCQRICLLFSMGMSPRALVDSLSGTLVTDPAAAQRMGLRLDQRVSLLNDWGMCLLCLGTIGDAVALFRYSLEVNVAINSPGNAAGCAQNLASALMRAGHLQVACETSEYAARLAEEDREAEAYSPVGHRAMNAYIRLHLGDIAYFMTWADECNRRGMTGGDFVTLHVRALVLMGSYQEAARWLTRALQRVGSIDGWETKWFCEFNILLAEVALGSGNWALASQYCDAAFGWAFQRNVRSHLCGIVCVRAQIGVAKLLKTKDGLHASVAACFHETDDGLRLAKACGFGIEYMDLLLTRAELHLFSASPSQALEDINVVLFVGDPSFGHLSGLALLPVTNPACGYVWAEARGRKLRAEALLLQAAQLLGRSTITGAEMHALSEDVRALVDEARMELKTCIGLQERLKHPSLVAIKERAKAVQKGTLTRYSLRPVHVSENLSVPVTSPKQVSQDVSPSRVPPKRHALLICSEQDLTDVARLRNELIQNGEFVFWTNDIVPGTDLQRAMFDALQRSYAVVVCLSQNVIKDKQSVFFSDLRMAIGESRRQRPGSIFLIPVRLADCEGLNAPLDDVRTLDGLHRVDLFPPERWADGVERLVQALRVARDAHTVG